MLNIGRDAERFLQPLLLPDALNYFRVSSSCDSILCKLIQYILIVDYLKKCRDTLTTTSPPTPSKSQKTTPAQSSDDKCGEQKHNNSSPTPSESQKTTPAQNCDDKCEKQMSTNLPCKILLPISITWNIISTVSCGRCTAYYAAVSFVTVSL